MNHFVQLSKEEVDLILSVNQELFARYLLYLKYHCGAAKDHIIDTTAKQFLAAVGYSDKSRSYISQLCEYNKVLQDKGIVQIQKYYQDGKERNTYKLAHQFTKHKAEAAVFSELLYNRPF